MFFLSRPYVMAFTTVCDGRGNNMRWYVLFAQIRYYNVKTAFLERDISHYDIFFVPLQRE